MMSRSRLCAFPFVPFQADGLQADEAAYATLLQKLAQAGISEVCALGSTGNYAYLTTAQRMRLAELTKKQLPDAQLMVGISHLNMAECLKLVEHAQKIGASSLLLAPVSYQPLSEAEAFGLYEYVHAHTDVPICVYDNPDTTHFHFSTAFYARLADLPRIRALKIPKVSRNLAEAAQQIAALKARLPGQTAVGISGDWWSLTALAAGCDVWYSVLAGIFPNYCRKMVEALAGSQEAAFAMNARLSGIWRLFEQYGSLRVTAAICQIQSAPHTPNLPKPLIGLQGADYAELAKILNSGRFD